MATCTLTIRDDTHGEYEDDLLYQRAEEKHVKAVIGGSRFTRSVVKLLKDWVASHPDCHRSELMLLGMGLYRIAFGDGDPLSANAPVLQRAFERTYRFKQEKLPKDTLSLRIVLEENARELATYPWEFLYMPLPDHGGFFIAGENTQLSLTRYVPNSDTWTADTAEEPDDARLRILIVVSAPRIADMTQFNVANFVQHMLNLDNNLFLTKKLPSPTREELREEIIRMRPHIIHFIGHGRPGRLALRKDDETLRREQEDYRDAVERGRKPGKVSEAEWIDSRTATGLLHTGLDAADAPSRLVFLHACEGATVDETQNSVEGFTNLARELVGRPGISGVVAMQYPIGVEEAEIFAKRFYTYISQGRQVDAAVALARRDFAQRPLNGRQEWDSRSFGTPVFYLRREDPLVPHRVARAEPGQGATLAPVGKEPCPNPDCRAFVIRVSSPAECRRCHYPFAPCPQQGCTGLIVPKPGFWCTMCDYIVEADRAARPGGAHKAAAERGVGRESSFEVGGQRPAGVITVEIPDQRVAEALEWPNPVEQRAPDGEEPRPPYQAQVERGAR